MTPPEAPATPAGQAPPAVSVRPQVMRKRSDFLAAAKARRQSTASMMVQARRRGDADPLMRVGFTCSKKVGNAVARNRAKRRLREAARHVLPDHGKPGWDYVLIGRHGATASRDFQDLRRDLIRALDKLHGTR
ncbi:MAG: ribonuclease P protein component [Rhodobacteraceae bacterium]|jgi:ribonuclease P protein component|nr:ribonuclease P protein component [Paracoccaceae bacterium]